MRRLILLLFSLPIHLFLHAQNAVTIHLNTSEIVTFEFKDNPTITYEGSTLILISQNTKVEYQLTDLEKLTFDTVETEVESVKSSLNDKAITIFDINGRPVKTIEPSDNPFLHLPINDLPIGIYIVRQADLSYKIIKE